MKSNANILYLSAEGCVKNYAAVINETADEKNYSGNVLMLREQVDNPVKNLPTLQNSLFAFSIVKLKYPYFLKSVVVKLFK